MDSSYKLLILAVSYLKEYSMVQKQNRVVVKAKNLKGP